MVPAPIRKGTVAAADSPAGVRCRTRKVGSGDERIKFVGPRVVGNYHTAVYSETGHGVGLQGGSGVERQGLTDTSRFQWEYILGPLAVSAIRDVGEGEMETTILALMRRVELQRYEHTRPDLRGFGVHFVRLGFAHRHDEVWSNAFDTVGEHDGVLVARKGSWREDRS